MLMRRRALVMCATARHAQASLAGLRDLALAAATVVLAGLSGDHAALRLLRSHILLLTEIDPMLVQYYDTIAPLSRLRRFRLMLRGHLSITTWMRPLFLLAFCRLRGARTPRDRSIHVVHHHLLAAGSC